jgi:enoyl-CoA hydratase
MSEIISLKALARITASPLEAETYSVAGGHNFLVVDVRSGEPELSAQYQPACVVLGLGPYANRQPVVDVMVADETELTMLVEAVDRQPVAAATMAQVLRHNETASNEQGLLAESLAYSTLQASDGFKRWIDDVERPVIKPSAQPPLLIERDDSQLTLILNRPECHNAYNMALKDALCEGLQLAHEDTSIDLVRLRGNGQSFSAGGDLSEFGSVEDAGLAHLSRTTRSAGALLSTLPARSEAWIHGACIGAGIELPAFAQQVTAHPDTFFQLPEVAMGLIPGAGGTVSIVKRVGRQRTAYLALSNQQLDAETALAWGLIDHLSREFFFDDAT